MYLITLKHFNYLFCLLFIAAGYKLIRSYKTEADEKDKLNDITHLVFLIHGIGHKIDNKKIIKNTSQ